MQNNNLTEQIKNRVSLLEIAQSRLNLKKKGNQWMALCPFHNEKTPSFTINPEKDMFYCFGCGKGGDVFAFLQEYEKISFPEALTYLANKAGVTLPAAKNIKPASPEVISKKNKQLQLLEKTKSFFIKELLSSKNQSVLDYCLRRGLTRYTIERFQLGYAPLNYKLQDIDLNNTFNSTDFIETGIQNSNSGSLFFRNRIMFPINDKDGRTIGFGGRELPPSDYGPKYINTKETSLFYKKTHLYGLFEGLKYLKSCKEVILVEGYLDVNTLHQAGFFAVAPLGTAISIEQIRILLRLNRTVYIAMDADEAGRRSTIRLGELILTEVPQQIMRFRFINMPNGEDPDSFMRKRTSKHFAELIHKSIYLSEILWQYLRSKVPDVSLESKIALKQEINELCRGIKDTELKQDFLNYFNKNLESEFSNSYNIAQPYGSGVGSLKSSTFRKNDFKGRENVSQKIIRKLPSHTLPASLVREYYLLAYVIACPLIYHDIDQQFANIQFANKDLDVLKQFLVEVLEKNHFKYLELKEELAKSGFSTILNNIVKVTGFTLTCADDDTENSLVKVKGLLDVMSRARIEEDFQNLKKETLDGLPEDQIRKKLEMLAELHKETIKKPR